MTESRFKVFLQVIVGLLIVALPALALAAADAVPRISKEDAKPMLGNPEVIFIDVRQSRDWNPSESKIKGSVREDAEAAATWAQKYPKEKTLIIYCA